MESWLKLSGAVGLDGLELADFPVTGRGVRILRRFKEGERILHSMWHSLDGRTCIRGSPSWTSSALCAAALVCRRHLLSAKNHDIK
ncbi:hypothetical protein QBC32DRAFT_352860 [Pseudoneurospora amorphoporcata]|uniref:Uncharacterized protein n=1 Tax=Pseudoneurospora amorphoporcata TaxID=241081 RepID=A0AAN6SCH0_9PEZI|nr:hypothetical protein QBC32DRAFT_352860 [Pseudoneurospora amorphoporcata]